MPTSSSLLKAICQLDGAPGVPDLWRDALLRALDGSSRAATALTCRGSLQFMLQVWPQATLTLAVRDPARQPTAKLLRRMQQAREQLAARKGLPTTLVLMQRGQADLGDTWWHVAFSALAQRDSTPNLTLILQLSDIPAQLVAFAGQAFRCLSALSITTFLHGQEDSIQLPPPSALPALTQLTVRRLSHAQQARLWSSVGPYMRQLISLTITIQPHHFFADPAADEAQIQIAIFSGLFSSQHTTHTLTTLSLPLYLDPWLAVLLQQHAPALSTLQVWRISNMVDAREVKGVRPHCSWRVLRLDNAYLGNDELQWMPMPAQGQLTIEAPEPMIVEVRVPLSDKVAETLARLDIQGARELHLQPDRSMQHGDIVTALQRLPHTQFPPTTTKLVLAFFTMSAQLATELSTVHAMGWCDISLDPCDWEWWGEPREMPRLPPLRKLRMGCTVRQSALHEMLACLTSVGELELGGGVDEDATGVPAGTLVPWQRVTTETCELPAFLKEARQMGGKAIWDKVGLYVTLTAQQVDNGEPARMAEQLSRVRILNLDSVHVDKHPDCPLMDQPRVLRASLAILCAMPCEAKSVFLRDWASTPQTVSLLRHSPHWRSSLHLGFESEAHVHDAAQPWPLSRAPWNIPRSYTTWAIEGCKLTLQEWCSFIHACPGDRTRHEPLTINAHYVGRLFGAGDWLDSIRDTIENQDTYPNVTWDVW